MNDSTVTEVGTADILKIMRMIPHRYPMLLVDRVVDIHEVDQVLAVATNHELALAVADRR